MIFKAEVYSINHDEVDHIEAESYEKLMLEVTKACGLKYPSQFKISVYVGNVIRYAYKHKRVDVYFGATCAESY